MKNLLILLVLCSAVSLNAQTGKQSTTIKFCFHEFQMPSNCNIESEYCVKREDANFSWIYVADDMLLFASNGLLKKLETYPDFNKQRISCYILNKKVNGFRVSYKMDNEVVYKIIAYGIINQQPVMIELGLKKKPLTNRDIPDFASQIVRLN